MTKKIITLGEVLMRLTPPNGLKLEQTSTFDLGFGGAEANVVASLARLGWHTRLITALPPSVIGEKALRTLQQSGIEVANQELDGRMGLYYYEPGFSLRSGKVIYDREFSAFATLKVGVINWHSIFEDATGFHWSGITPSLSIDLACLCKEALEVAQELGLTISADLNYRPTLWNYGMKAYEIMPDLVQYCDVLLGGIEDSEPVLGLPVEACTSDQEVFQLWQQKFPKLKIITTTKRWNANATSNDISALLWDGTILYESKSYSISPIVDRIGAGDAYMAGLLHGINKWSDSPQKAVDFAIAASALKHTIVGDFNWATEAEVLAVLHGASGSRVAR
ncbi:PfkB family carbohydrate kinase [Flavobacterium sp. TSSA_36]|uniref:PfkB family carbohydrate kinase n=1 Tax=Flavobacterium sp. TSSA_36 TaxID=3447669 RepID=UPI003F36AE55